MALVFMIFAVTGVAMAWRGGTRDWVALALVAVLGPVVSLAVLNAAWTAVQPVLPALAVLAVVAAVVVGIAVSQSPADDKKQKRLAAEPPTEAPKTSKKRRLDAE
jgi:CHASE2 domain-containing sensor protein